jgi:hypothetical protein
MLLMSYPHERKSKDAVIEQAIRHINHHDGVLEKWYVGIEENGSDRDSRNNRHLMRYELPTEDDAKSAMSLLLDQGLQADDEYGAQPTVLFVYMRK